MMTKLNMHEMIKIIMQVYYKNNTKKKTVNEQLTQAKYFCKLREKILSKKRCRK